MIRYYLVSVLLLCFSMQVYADQSFRYREVLEKGTLITDLVVTKTTDSKYSIEHKTDVSQMLSHTDSYFNTFRVEFNDTQEDIEINAIKDKNTILVKGRLGNEVLDRRFTVDESPWINSFEIGFSKFIRSDKKEMLFWALRPTDWSVFKMVIYKQSDEIVSIDGETYDCIKTKITLPGFASLFWSGEYWFRRSDGVLVREVEPRLKELVR